MSQELRDRRDAIVREHGPWRAYNIDLGGGVFTISPDADAMAEQRVDRIVQAVADCARQPLAGLRVLDLGCFEGAFAIRLAQAGATTLGLEARPEHVAKARFAAEVLELDRAEFQHCDVRELSAERHGTFDVVLCLGILYHLDAPECFELMARVAEVCDGFAVVETQIGLSGGRRERWRGNEYRGRTYPEDTRREGASVRNEQSFWPTRASLLNLIADVGFTSAAELLTPVVVDLAAYRDHVTLVAHKGVPGPASARWPERLARTAHPEQGRRYRLRDRLARARGRDMARRVFRG